MKVISFIVFFLIACFPLSQAIRSNPSEDLGAVQGLFIFGDSALDAGQNTYIPGSRIMSAVPPYGKSYFDKPTGRWTDGRTIGDFLAQALGLPLLPPYLRPGANFSSGVNFASAGAGLLDATNAHQVLKKQRTHVVVVVHLTQQSFVLMLINMIGSQITRTSTNNLYVAIQRTTYTLIAITSLKLAIG
ncbi:GDSL esterase/lipase 5 [Selaginella moellendorffii]|uniref:GDSL esterase/lipase 5 n=1 Tax=Selaginella moellendorffii TaxID=88036 RepID=UPI000D1D099F|nr:GDSL esterase/lipase 5 [Selaginella moellendorffii]|eukprot:XP_024542888.1 GDSL esterase/lipase 5 [Selaginella moellendorffii]